jgi:hypothetical protein
MPRHRVLLRNLSNQELLASDLCGWLCNGQIDWLLGGLKVIIVQSVCWAAAHLCGTLAVHHISNPHSVIVCTTSIDQVANRWGQGMCLSAA